MDQDQKDPTEPQQTGMHPSTWFAGLQKLSEDANHSIFITVIPGTATQGQDLKLNLLAPLGGPLEDSLAAIEKYLRSPAAETRGELYRVKDRAQKAYETALGAVLEARSDVKDAWDAINDDIDETLDAAWAAAEAEAPAEEDEQDVQQEGDGA